MENSTSIHNQKETLQGVTLEERMEERLSLLKQDLNKKLPFVFQTQNASSFSHHKHHSEVTIPLAKQFMAEDITDSLAALPNSHILYADRSLDCKKYHVIGFSNSGRERMFVFYIDSLMFGVVEEVTFDFYESMEFMLMRLRDIFFTSGNEQAKSRRIYQLERMTAKELWNAFNL